MDFFYFLLIGAISGWLAGKFWKGGRFGLLRNIIAGIVGAVFGGWLAAHSGIGCIILLCQLIISAVGAWFFIFIITLSKSKV